MRGIECLKAGIAAAALIAGAALAQQAVHYASIQPGDQAIPIGPVPHPQGFGFHNLAGGAKLKGDRVVVADYTRFHLIAPPHGYEWVQSGNHFVLITISTGIIANIALASN